MTGVRKKSKRYGKIIKKGDILSKAYNENPNRRIYIPEWRFHLDIINFIEDGANKNNVTRSRFFETVIKNHFLLNGNDIKMDTKLENIKSSSQKKYIKFFG